MQETLEQLRDGLSGDTVRTQTDKLIQKVGSANCTACAIKADANMTGLATCLPQKSKRRLLRCRLALYNSFLTFLARLSCG